MYKKTILNHVFSSANFTSQEMEEVLELFTNISFNKNDYIFKEGNTLNHYYFLEKGFIRSFIDDYEGNEVTTKFYSKSDIVIDWTSFMLRHPTQENFIATMDCDCWRLSYALFLSSLALPLLTNYFAIESAGKSAELNNYEIRNIQILVFGFFICLWVLASILSINGHLYGNTLPPKPILFLVLPLSIFLYVLSRKSKIFQKLFNAIKIETLINIHSNTSPLCYTICIQEEDLKY